MAILRMWGLDNYNNIAELFQDDIVKLGSLDPTFSTTAGRFGGTMFGQRSTGGTVHFRMDIAETPSTVYWGAAVKRGFVGPMTSDGEWIAFRADGTTHWNIDFDLDSARCVVQRLGANQGDFFMSPNKWHYLECKSIIHDTTGEITIQLDGIEVFSQTGVDTLNGASAYVNQFYFNGTNSDDLIFQYDDIIVHTEADFLGDQRMVTYRPDADGDASAFTPLAGTNWESVDDTPGPDDDTTYVESSTAAHQDLYTTTNMTGTIVTIHAVNVKAYARKDDGGARSIILLNKTGTTTGLGATVALAETYDFYNEIFELDPDTASTWTESGVNGMQIGMENV